MASGSVVNGAISRVVFLRGVLKDWKCMFESESPRSEKMKESLE